MGGSFAGAWWGRRRLGVVPQSAEGRFLAASRWASAVTALLVTLPLDAFTASAWRAAANNLPFAYAFKQLKWYAGFGPIPEVVALPPGRFTMGCKPGRDDVHGATCEKDDMPAVEVALAKPCAIAKYELTFEQYDYFVWSTGGKGFGGSRYPSDAAWGRAGLPVINVSWDDAQQYVQWLSAKTGQPWRLPPSEKEWEYAERGGNDTTAFWWGNEAGQGRANCNDCDPRYRERTAQVGSYECNAYGVCDTAGNVWEWVQDAVGTGAINLRMLRGGSWFDFPESTRAASRHYFGPGTRDDNIGLRVCRGSPIE